MAELKFLGIVVLVALSVGFAVDKWGPDWKSREEVMREDVSAMKEDVRVLRELHERGVDHSSNEELVTYLGKIESELGAIRVMMEEDRR